MGKTGGISPSFALEQTLWSDGLKSVGVDEVGRGCLAGPVVSAAVAFPADVYKDPKVVPDWISLVTDSKLLKPEVREKLALDIMGFCHVQVAWCDAGQIDCMNILRASLHSMREALWPFQGLAQAVLVDGNLNPFEERLGAVGNLDQRCGFQKIVTLVKGDQKSLSIAAASIVAKVFRDQWMEELSDIFPNYELGGHKGYPTPRHKALLREHGESLLHRKSFRWT